MSLYKTAAKNLPISDLSITQRVFAGLTDRLDDIVLIDGVDGRQFTASTNLAWSSRLPLRRTSHRIFSPEQLPDGLHDIISLPRERHCTAHVSFAQGRLGPLSP